MLNVGVVLQFRYKILSHLAGGGILEITGIRRRDHQWPHCFARRSLETHGVEPYDQQNDGDEPGM